MKSAPITTTLKHTLSAKQRAEGGDEVFISVGQEMHNVPLEQEDEYRAKLSESLAAWLEDRVGTVAAATFEGYAETEEGEAETEEAEEDDETAEGEEDELTLEDVQKMKLPELKALVEEYELEVEPKLKIKELREAVVEALFAESEEDETEEETEEDEADGEEAEGYDEEELSGMKLAELTEIAEEWEIEVSIPKGAGLKEKKALYIAAILAEQEG